MNKINELRSFLKQCRELFSQIDPESKFNDFRIRLEKMVIELSAANETMRRTIDDLKKDVDRNITFSNLEAFDNNSSRYSSLCDHLFDEIVKRGDQFKIFSTQEFIQILRDRHYEGKSFNNDPHRTVYNCVIRDRKERFHKFSRSGFVMNERIAQRAREKNLMWEAQNDTNRNDQSVIEVDESKALSVV